ncbi:Yip1 family protein [Methylotenera mobilis]|uniref:Yip1 domain-containing protein n=1 Tax=Methylotenera mobilis (strain JLW8 / ATCC BAA-1282 / DSM 17540) TaxID=583345 RepID=C6WVT0_METML|nr:Yip1 family protein [Methylotenera mobilis]ACT48029.1 protein of unknown function DUF1282 [Methylotenera mobilis JLW8]
MSLLNLFWLFFVPTKGWRHLVQRKLSMHRLYLLHVVPMSLIPPLFVYCAAGKYAGGLLPALPSHKLLLVAAILFVVELASVPVMGLIIRQLGEVAEIHPSYHQAFTLAAVAPTPLWLAPIVLLVPDMTFNLVVLTMALMATVGFIYYGVPAVFHIKERGHAILMFGAVLTAGVIGWALLMIVTLVVLGSVQNL